MFRQVVSNNGDVFDFVCLRNDDLRAKLVPAESETIPAPNLDSLGVVIVSFCSGWSIVVKGGKQVTLPDFIPSPFPSPSEELQGGSVGVDKGKGVVSAEMDGCDVGGPLVSVTPSCFDMEMFFGEEPIR